MFRPRLASGFAIAAALVLSWPSSAFAQVSQRPYKSLFGGSASGTDRNEDWVMFTVTQAYDQDVLGDIGQPLQKALEQGGFYTELNGETNYRVTGRRVELSLNGGTTFRYYRDEDAVVGVGHHGGMGATFHLSPATSLLVSQTIAYSPSYLYGLFADVMAPQPGLAKVSTNYAVNDYSSYNYGTNVMLIQHLGPRSTLSVHGSEAYTDFSTSVPLLPGATALRNLLSYEAGGTFTEGLSRNVRMIVGYTFRRAEYFDGTFPTAHDLNLGVEYDRPLSKTRRTYLRFNTGSVALQAPAPGESSAVLRQQYRLSGNVALSTQFGRTWQADGGYNRGVGFIDGLSTPVLTDGVTAAMSGLLNARTSLLLTGAYSVGQPTIASTTHGFTTYTANARTSFAVSRKWALFVEYLYYYYDFSAGVVPVGAPPQVSRNSGRVGLSLWLPLKGR